MPPGGCPARPAGSARDGRAGRGLPSALRAGTLLENLGRDPAGAYYADLAFLKPADARALMGLSPDRDPATSPVYAGGHRPYRRCPSTDAVQRAEYADLKVYLPNDPLVKVDRMSMAHGLEVRCPLLDRRVVELAFRIPASRKQVGRQGKTLLRAARAAAAARRTLGAPQARVHGSSRSMDWRTACRDVRRRGAAAIDGDWRLRGREGTPPSIPRPSDRPGRPRLHVLGCMGPRAVASTGRGSSFPDTAVGTRNSFQGTA